MVTQLTCPHCHESVDIVDDSVASCPHCAGNLRSPAGGDLDSPLASTRVLGEGLEPVQSTYNLGRSPAAEASIGGKAVENDLFAPATDRNHRGRGVTTRGIDDPRTVELEAARTQVQQRRQRQMRGRLKIVIGIAIALAAVVGFLAYVMYLH